MNRKSWTVFSVVALVVSSALVMGGARAQTGATQAPAAKAPAPKMAEEQFKNIQVLKGVPADQVIPAMQFITASLGVECNFCHVLGAFEKDEKKPKDTARKMMTMMFAINKENFNGKREVTCYSCHRGRTEPLGTPMIASDEPTPTPSGANRDDDEKVTTSGLPPDDLFEKYLRSVGGEAAVNHITSRVQKGTISVGGQEMQIDIFSKDPQKRASVMHTPDGDSATIFDGHAGWLGIPRRPAREMHGADIEGAAMDADLHFATHLRQMFSEVREGKPEKIGTRDAYVVTGSREGKPSLRLYFDEQSGLLIRLLRFSESPLGRLPTQIDYADYRDVDGLKIPFRWTLARPGNTFTIQVSEVKQNVPVDDAKFAKPPDPPLEQKPPAK